MKVYHKTVGLASENTYVLVNDEKEALIIDPGDRGLDLIKWIEDHQWQPKAILLTHSHFDHIGAVDDLRLHFKIPVYIHEMEKDFLTDGSLNLSSAMLGFAITQEPADYLWTADDMSGLKTIGNFKFKISHLPGHSPGHVVYIFDAENIAIVGDTIFKQSVGRTDLPGGSFQKLFSGIKAHLLTLPGDMTLYPGHGPATTVQDEIKNNPFLKR